MYYNAYNHDKLEPSYGLRVDRTVYFDKENANIEPLLTLSLEELQQMSADSAKAEQAIYETMKTQASEWERQAGETLLYNKAIEYLKFEPVTHTSNKWQEQSYGISVISNMVYKMLYSIYERTHYDKELKNSVVDSWQLNWSICLNLPRMFDFVKIAGQERKVFKKKEDMQKYLDGRIKAYSHLFTELSPPIPLEYAKYFMVNGVLLRGYTVGC